MWQFSVDAPLQLGAGAGAPQGSRSSVNVPLWFQILYNQQSVEVQGNLKRKLISQLQPDTDYSFVLTSRGNIAGGLQQQVSIRTAPDLLQAKPSKHLALGSRITISLPAVQTSARVRSVALRPNIAVAERRHCRSQSPPPHAHTAALARDWLKGLSGPVTLQRRLTERVGDCG